MNAKPTPGWNTIRSEFPALSNWTYLNTATFGQLPRCAADAMHQHLSHRDRTACSDFLSWFSDMDEIRDQCARLIHCEPADIALVPNASTGLSTLMQGLCWKPGDEVLTLEDEFPNQLYVSALLDRFGARLKAVPWPEFYDSISKQTRLAVLSTVNYATGFRLPVEEISRTLRERDVLLYLDGSQSIGALQFDTSRIRPSALCVDAYKWMLSANGAGFLYVDPDLRKHLSASIVGWRSDRAWRSVDALNQGRPVFVESAEKYEGGMLSFAPLYGMGAVIRMMLDIGPAAIEARVLQLAAKIRCSFRELGAEVNPEGSQIVTAALPGVDVRMVVSALKEQRILVSARHGRLRVSPHFYNNHEDIERIAQAIRLQWTPSQAPFTQRSWARR